MPTADKYLIEVARLRKRPQFLFVREGITERRKSIVVQARRRGGEAPGSHIGEGFTATKKIGNAAVRNRAKRRLRAASRALLPRLATPGADYVFIARHNTADIAFARLLDDMESALISVAGQL